MLKKYVRKSHWHRHNQTKKFGEILEFLKIDFFLPTIAFFPEHQIFFSLHCMHNFIGPKLKNIDLI